MCRSVGAAVVAHQEALGCDGDAVTVAGGDGRQWAPGGHGAFLGSVVGGDEGVVVAGGGDGGQWGGDGAGGGSSAAELGDEGCPGSVELLLVLVFQASGIGVVGGCQLPVQ